MRINSLLVTPLNLSGWTTDTVDFNHPITVTQAPNGTGKTPLLKCLVYGLGLKVELPIEIKQKCGSVEIVIQFGNKQFKLNRPIQDTFQITVADLTTLESTIFSNETGYSHWLNSQIGLPSVELTSRQAGRGSIVYSNVLIPMFWIDQDHGWSKTYFSDADFIKEQDGELTRLFLGTRVRYPFSQRQDFEKAKAELNATEVRLQLINRAIDQEKRDLKDVAIDSSPSIQNEIAEIQDRLSSLDNDIASSSRIGESFDERILEAIS